MKKSITLLFALVVALSMSFGQGFLKVDGKRIVDEKGNNVLLRGMGLGGWMLQEGYMLQVYDEGEQQQHMIRKNITGLIGEEKTQAFYDAWLANHTRKIDIDSLARWGFNSVRLAMHYNLYTLPVEKEPVAGQNTWIEKGFKMTDDLLSWCKANKLYLILDLHGAPGGQGNDLNISDRDPSMPSLWQSEANQQKTIALWRKLAERYKDEPWIGAYDIINEPNWGFEKADDKNGCNEATNAPLRKLMIDITKAIREVDQKHIVIIEGNCWGNNYKGVFPLWDSNIVVSFHKYWSFNNKETIQGPLDIREQQNVPIWLGETGENSNGWYTDAIRLMESNNIGWAWWPLKKVGNNNPLEVRAPEGYKEQVLKNWSNGQLKPHAAMVEKVLMQLAENLKLENCIYHKDVVDAMFRQVRTNDIKPFKKHVPGAAIMASDYDLGRNRYAYYDLDTGNYWVSGKPGEGNSFHFYRNDGVDVAGDENSKWIDNMQDGEWLKYTITTAAAGSYKVSLSLGAAGGGKVAVSVNGATPKEVTLDQRSEWTKVPFGAMTFKKGTNEVKVSVVSGGFRFSQVYIEK